jgi:hypothetical protein
MNRASSWGKLCGLVFDEFTGYREFFTWQCDLSDALEKAKALPKEARSLAALLDLIYQAYGVQHAKGFSRWGDKTPINTFFLPLIDRVFPNAQYIHIIRDPRAVAVSYRKAAETAPGIKMMSYSEAARLWREAIVCARALGQHVGNARYTEVRYENLVMKPDEELYRLCSFLRLEFKSSMLEYYKQFDRMGDTRHYTHHDNVGKPLDPGAAERWRKKITRKDQQEILRYAGDLANNLGYL